MAAQDARRGFWCGVTASPQPAVLLSPPGHRAASAQLSFIWTGEALARLPTETTVCFGAVAPTEKKHWLSLVSVPTKTNKRNEK